MSNCSEEEIWDAIQVYKCHDRGLLMPFVNEYTWSVNFRIAIYLVGLLWSFLAVAIIADVFMCSIEKITSHTRMIRVANPDSDNGYDEIEVKVWNDTVANLTLMALGSSAPEILLSCIEIVGKGFKAGDLGPSTIVGSAAFNLLCIIGVCIIVIPDGEVRIIRTIKVFLVTASFSLFAYIWLIIILMISSKDIVEVWEAVLTLLFFPILVIIAYIADRNFCGGKKRVDDKEMELGFNAEAKPAGLFKNKKYSVNDPEGQSMLVDGDGKMNEAKMREFIKETKKVHPNLTEEQLSKLATAKIAAEQSHDRLWYRINAVRKLGGGVKLDPVMSQQLHNIYNSLQSGEDDKDAPIRQSQFLGSNLDLSEGGQKPVIEFASTQCAVLEGAGKVAFGIRRYGKTDSKVTVRVETIDGTAEAEQDYIPMKENLIFEAGETVKNLEIAIIDDNEWEPDEVFFVKLQIDSHEQTVTGATLGQKKIMQITIINDDEPGTFGFTKPSMLFKESIGRAEIPVTRTNGADGKVSVHWKTEDMSATSGKDYEGGEGVLEFEHGETEKNINLIIYEDQTPEKDECFKIDLTEVSEGAQLGRIHKTIVTLVNDDEYDSMISRLVKSAQANVDSLRIENVTYTDQFRNAMNVNGGELEGASHLDYLMHFLTFGFKIIFAIVPPPAYCNGWLSFVVSLSLIGVLTAIVGDLAGIFGCLIGLKDSVTAITFVALGTSLPDLFASKQAATQENTADNSIGNVTGSNSVNVFLGLGLPWVIASIYWWSKNQSFVVEAGALGFSVVIYTCCAIACIVLILARRYLPLFGGELGGKHVPKIVSGIFLFFLWIFYVVMSSLQAYEHIEGF